MAGVRREDLIGVGLIFLVHLLLGAFLLSRSDRFCFGDCITEMLPRLYAVARSFQSGGLPLWDEATFAGGRPLWVSAGGIYYPLLYPLYLFAGGADPARASTLLLLLPFLLHVAWAAVGAFLFARKALRLSAAGALVTAVVYAYSPPFLVLDFVMQAQVYSYLPWIVLASVRVLKTGSRRAWAAGALLVGAMSFAGNPDLVNRVLFLIGLQVAGFWLLSSWQQGAAATVIVRLLSLLAMVVVGLGTFGFGWLGFREGIAWVRYPLPLSCAQVAALTDESSAPVGSLLSVFYPASFPRLLTLANIGAGSVVISAAWCALVTLRRQGRDVRGHVLVAGGIVVFSVLVALGRHTPVFEGLCRTLPLFFSFPHPVYYTLGVSWGIAILAGAGVMALASAPPGRGALLWCCWPILAAAAIAASQVPIPSLDWSERSTAAVVYMLALAVFLAVLLSLPRHRRPLAFCGAALVEAMIAPFHLAAALPSGESPHPLDYRTWTISRNPTVELRPVLQRLADEDAARFVGLRSFFDNQAWLVGGRALLGHSSKPVAPRLQETFSTFTFNAPYELWLYALPRFLANMNVGYLVADRTPLHHFLHPPEPLRRGLDELHAAVRRLPLVARTSHYDLRQLADPLPYVYTQDRVFAVGEGEQRDRLLYSDLRLGAYVDPAVLAGRGAGSDTREQGSEASVQHFEELQEANPVRSIDRSQANRKTVKIEVRREALMVIAEVWHPGWRAWVDGKERTVWPVNYLQQGVWLDAGARVVELRFEPRALPYGIAASALSFLALVLAGTAGTSRHRPGASGSSTRAPSAPPGDGPEKASISM